MTGDILNHILHLEKCRNNVIDVIASQHIPKAIITADGEFKIVHPKINKDLVLLLEYYSKKINKLHSMNNRPCEMREDL